MNKETGGPAFPTSDWDENGRAYKIHGTTLRDYFAAKAMQAILSNPEYGDESDSLAGAAYYVADAMLKARGL
jgi:hypothetical protein